MSKLGRLGRLGAFVLPFAVYIPQTRCHTTDLGTMDKQRSRFESRLSQSNHLWLQPLGGQKSSMEDESPRTKGDQPLDVQFVLDTFLGTTESSSVKLDSEGHLSNQAPGGEQQQLIRWEWFDDRSSWWNRITAQRQIWQKVHNTAMDSGWLGSSNPEQTLALVLLLDQFSRFIFSGKRKFHSDSRALDVAKRAIREGLDKRVPPHMRMWFYFPLMHSEELADQQQSKELFSELAAQHPGIKPLMPSVHAHYDAVAKFGRHPERNSALGRQSTREERIFLGVQKTS